MKIERFGSHFKVRVLDKDSGTSVTLFGKSIASLMREILDYEKKYINN